MFLAWGMASLPSTPAHAQTDALIEGAKLCTRYLPRYEREYAIPTHLLSAIASTESGRFHRGLKLRLPWPWTINTGGKGYYYDTKDEAIAAVRKFRAKGITSIDVGCMQVNLHHHPDAFASLDEAFEPETNVAYAAGFLRTLYQSGGSWKKAAGDYHSRTPSRGREYVGQVYDSWFNIIDKLRAARLHVPDSSVVAMNDMKNGTEPRADTQKVARLASADAALKPSAGTRSKPVVIKRAAKSAQPEKPVQKIAQHTRPHMRSIQIASVSSPSTSQQSGLMVVRPDVAPEIMPALQTSSIAPINIPPAAPITMAQSNVSMASANDSRVAEIISDRRPVSSLPDNSLRRAGPNFIFSD